jgi:uncharacterized protein YndB with AHSA1/START domain
MSKRDAVEVSGVVAGSVEAVFDAFLDGATHSAMTGSEATSVAEVGASFTAWDGYIQGKHLAFARPSKIVQAWRAADFPDGAPDSRLEILLEPVKGGTRVTFVHSDIPEGMGAAFRDGWTKYYHRPDGGVFRSAKQRLTRRPRDGRAHQRAPSVAAGFTVVSITAPSL